jgi:replicative DNA helicase
MPARAMVHEASELLMDSFENQIEPLRTGLDDLDKLVRIRPGHLVYLAARPGVGKTAFALNLARSVAKAGKKVLFFSLEMTRFELLLRLVAIDGGFDCAACIDAQNPEHPDLYRVQKGFLEIATWPLWVEDAGRMNGPELASAAKKLHDAEELDLIIIDYIQLMRGDGSKDGRQSEVEEISRSLKELAKTLGLPVVCLAQLNRDTEKRKGAIPRVSDLRDSGSLEQDADTVLLLHRDRDADGVMGDEGAVIVGKQRHGKLGRISLVFDGATQRFREVW